MREVNQNFHEHWNRLPDWITFHMTPEAFITSKTINNKYEYTFKNLRDVQQMCGKRINLILYEKVQRILKLLISSCEAAQLPISPTMPLTLPIEHTILRLRKKGCSHLRKLYCKMAEFDKLKSKTNDNPTHITTTDQKEIRKTTSNFFQKIYNKQS